tara:strand:+ start:690 stop:1706 length:1017 start_codon:yes stop_codon:yes gene_type:complete
MALPNSGPLSLDQIHVEAGGNSGSSASINDADIRGMIGKSDGAQSSFSDFYGASSSVTINQTISNSTNNYNMASNRGPTYSAGVTNYTLTINPGVTVGTNSTSSTSLQTGSPWSSGDTIIVENYGSVKGGGGPGGAGGSLSTPQNFSGPNPQHITPGVAGTTVNGAAFNAAYPVTFKNFGSIYGGGGGGGGGGSRRFAKGAGKNTSLYQVGSAGGGGGGAGVTAGTGGPITRAGEPFNNSPGTAGSAGSANAGGAGGTGAMQPSNPFDNMETFGQTGGTGGGLGSDGAAGNINPFGNAAGDHQNVFSNAAPGGTRGFITSNSSSITFNPSGTQGGRTS